VQAFLSFQTPFTALFLIILPFTKLFAISLAYLADFLYLCTINNYKSLYMLQGNQNSQLSIINYQSLGRTQLAQMYFPYIMPKSAWEKLRSLLLEDPDLAHLTKLRRRTFLPAEVNIIYQHLGQP
jgi:hypothetical protein